MQKGVICIIGRGKGKMAEWLKAPLSKSGRGESPSRVQIPLFPQLMYSSGGQDLKTGGRCAEAGELGKGTQVQDLEYFVIKM
jgi:hypothetical protein